MDALYAYGHQNEINQKVVIIGGGSIGSELAKLLYSNRITGEII